MWASYTATEPRAGFDGTRGRFALRDGGCVDAHSWRASDTSFLPSPSCMRSHALPDDGVERVRKKAARAAIQAAHASEVSSLLEVTLDEPRVAPVVELVPDGYRLSRKAAVGERDDDRRSH